jgi:hypothetical protein
MIGITFGSVLLFGAGRHHLIPANATGYLRRMASLLGGMLAVGLGLYMAVIAPNRSYTPLEQRIVVDQETLARDQNSQPAAAPGERTQLANDQASLKRAGQVDRASAIALAAIEIPLSEAAVLGGELLTFRFLRIRRRRAEGDRRKATDLVQQADAGFIARLTARLVSDGHDENDMADILARVRHLGDTYRDHVMAGPGYSDPAAGPGPESATSPDEAKPPRSSQRSNRQRITVNLTPRSWQALERAVKQTGDSQTDTINRALQVYSYLANITENDGTVYVRGAGSDELERLHII